MFKLDLERAEEPEIKLPTSIGSLKKQESSKKTSTSALLTMRAKFRHKLKKVGKTTRQFRYDLNQILYDYTVEMTNRFKA